MTLKVKNNWVGYADRSAQQTKDKLLERMGIAAPEITDHTDNNPLIINIGQFSGIAEHNNYYIDNAAREPFIEVLRLYSSMVNATRILDYRIKAGSPESTDVIFTLSSPAPLGGISIPINTEIQSNSTSAVFYTTKTETIAEGETQVIIPAAQITNINNVVLGQTNGTKRQTFSLGKNYVQNSLSVTINNELYVEANTFAYSSGDSKVFIVEADADQNSILTFGDGIKGALPIQGFNVVATYRETQGPDGRVPSNDLQSILNAPTLPGGYSLTCNNPNQSSGGVLVESLESIRLNAPLSIRTLDRAVANGDYQIIALQVPGVDKALEVFCCGKEVEVYVAPEAGDEGGIASLSLLNSVEDYFKDKKMVTTFVKPLPAGLSYLVLSVDVTPKFRMDRIKTSEDVEQALLQEYNYNNQDIDKSIRISDILALIDNLEKVDFANILVLYIKPYARPIEHIVPLDWGSQVKPENNSNKNYLITYTSSGNISIIRDNTFIQVLNIGETYNDGFVEFTINSSTLYQAGMEWKFTAYSYGVDIVLDDHTVPLLLQENLTINVNPSEDGSQCGC